jgi:hypothetical protein
MYCWFTTSDGYTKHNNPNTLDYVPGEPPKDPNYSRIDYRLECVSKGIARVGWPNTGDLRAGRFGEGRLAPSGYSFESITVEQRRYLSEFSSILAGDLIVIPANEDAGDIHVGLVLTPDNKIESPYLNPRTAAYYYYHNIAEGDYCELAHRVNVIWAKNEDGETAVIHLSGIRGVWRKPFSKVVQQEENIIKFAHKYKLL